MYEALFYLSFCSPKVILNSSCNAFIFHMSKRQPLQQNYQIKILWWKVKKKKNHVLKSCWLSAMFAFNFTTNTNNEKSCGELDCISGIGHADHISWTWILLHKFKGRRSSIFHLHNSSVKHFKLLSFLLSPFIFWFSYDVRWLIIFLLFLLSSLEWGKLEQGLHFCFRGGIGLWCMQF